MICSVTVSVSRHCSLGTIWYKYQIFRLRSAIQLDKNGGYVPLCILYSKQKLLLRQITNVYMTKIVLDYILSAHAFTSVRTEVVPSMQQIPCRWAYVLAFQNKICITIPTLFSLPPKEVLRSKNGQHSVACQLSLYNPEIFVQPNFIKSSPEHSDQRLSSAFLSVLCFTSHNIKSRT
jgi:hypothetical protein